MKSSTRYFLATVGIGFGVFVMTPDSTASQSCPVVQKLSAQWWEWALSIPTEVSPVLDPTGEDCMVGQHGDTWFLGGSFLGGTAVRSCTIPDDRKLFFPVLTSAVFDSPGICQGPQSLSVAELRALNAGFINAATDISAELDGEPITPHRASSKVFDVALPEDNIFDLVCPPPGVPAGVYGPTVADGFYVSLEALPVGDHVLHFHAEVPHEEVPSLSFVQDVTYHLTIVPSHH